MFPIGTRVSMVISTANKKLSPRCGSVGYVSGIGPTKFLTKNNSDGLIATPLSIVFIKYGNENRFRQERRVILNVIPIELYNSEQDVEKNIKNFKRSLKKKFSFFKKQTEHYGAVCTGVVIPSNKFINLTECKKIEIESWLQSYTKHYHFNKIRGNILKKLGYTQEFISQLKTDYSELLLQDVVTSMRAAGTVYTARNYDNYLYAFKLMLEKTHLLPIQIRVNEFLDMYVKDIFDGKKSIQKEEMVKKYSTDKTHHIAASNINKMSVALTMLNHSKGA